MIRVSRWAGASSSPSYPQSVCGARVIRTHGCGGRLARSISALFHRYRLRRRSSTSLYFSSFVLSTAASVPPFMGHCDRLDGVCLRSVRARNVEFVFLPPTAPITLSSQPRRHFVPGNRYEVVATNANVGADVRVTSPRLRRNDIKA